jgi:hypothetical protein
MNEDGIVVREEGKKCGCVEKGVCFFKKLMLQLSVQWRCPTVIVCPKHNVMLQVMKCGLSLASIININLIVINVGRKY